MKRRRFLGLAALPLAVALPVVAAPRHYVVEEKFHLFDWHHTAAISWRMSDGTRHGLRMHRITWAEWNPATAALRFFVPPRVTEEEREILREAMRERLVAR